jgi:uncharacterized membrane protein YraQ (UPF0718 family)
MIGTIVNRGHGIRLVYAVILLVVLAVFFWTQSRYPGLNDKAIMSGAIQLEDPLSFEAMIPITEDMGTLERIWTSTLNWIDTNKKGMTFGVLFGAGFLTLLGYLRRRSFNDPFANSFYGLFIGAPLGVCVNCAAPIAKGLYQGGSRAETTLSAMIASPTLNVVVLTMAFALLPFYIFIAKIVLSLALILVAVPLLCRLIPSERLNYGAPEPNTPSPPDQLEAGLFGGEPWHKAASRFAIDYLKSLWFIIRVTVPLMLLAGLLGAIVATLMPVDWVASAPFGPLSAIAVGVVGTILPVPMGFDVVFSGAMLNAGIGHGYAMTLVFTLGSYSIYSFLIVGGSVGWRAAGLLAGTVALIGVVSGLLVQAWYEHQTARALEMLVEPVASAPASGGAKSFTLKQAADSGAIEVSFTPFGEPQGPDASGFERLEAWERGIDHPVEFSFADMWPPFWEGRSIAAGDFDRDGDIDLVFASTRAGLYLYANDGAAQFARVEADLGPVADMPVFNATLVDIDNDGWPDLVLTTYRQGEWVLPNEQGRFDPAQMYRVANRDDAVMVMAASYGDVDRDGDLDAVFGNWAAGWYRRVPGEESRNRVVFNDAGRLDGARFEELPGIPGETLSILFSDIDANGTQDLLVGNDFEVPDYFYLGDGEGGFEAITHRDGVIPMTTTTTMSLTSADFGNDGTMELYAAQIAGRASGVSDRLNLQPIERYCDSIERDSDREICQRNMDIKRWYRAGNSLDPSNAPRCARLDEPYQSECRGMLIKDLAIQRRDPSLCNLIPASQSRVRDYCQIHFRPTRPMGEAEQDAAVAQILARNVLLERQADGRYAETAQARGLEIGGWSWDVSIADFDNDGWQDVYVVNGTWVPNEVTPSNIFYRNRGDGSFEEVTQDAGLMDYHMTAAAVVADFDNDGDLDMVTAPVNAPAALFLNNATDRQSLSVRLVDHQGNRDGIGARLTLHGGLEGADQQVRELQLGGGFMSFDAPIAHFGLDEGIAAERLSIRWADGSVSTIAGPLEAGGQYTITRSSISVDEE